MKNKMRYYSYTPVGWIILFLALILVWRCQTQKPNDKSSQKEKNITLESVAVSPNGRYVVMIDYPLGRIWVMDLQSLPLKMRVVDSVRSLSTATFSWDGQYLLVGSIDSTIYAWETIHWKRLQDTLKVSHRIVNTMANKPYSNFWISGSGLHESSIFTLFTFQTDSFPYFTKQKVLFKSGWFEYPLGMIFHPSDNELVVQGYWGDLMRLTFDSEKIFKHPYSIFTREWHGFSSLSFSPCGNFLAFKPLNYSAIYIYDWNKNKIIQKLNVDLEANMVFSQDGKYLISIFSEEDDYPTLYFWDTQTWKLKQEQKLQISLWSYDISHIPFRKWVVIYGDYLFLIWDYHKKKRLFQKKFQYLTIE